MTIEKTLGHRIQQFPSAPGFSDGEIKVQVYQAMKDWATQENRLLNDKLDKILNIIDSIPDNFEYDPGDVINRIGMIVGAY